MFLRPCWLQTERKKKGENPSRLAHFFTQAGTQGRCFPVRLPLKTFFWAVAITPIRRRCLWRGDKVQVHASPKDYGKILCSSVRNMYRDLWLSTLSLDYFLSFASVLVLSICGNLRSNTPSMYSNHKVQQKRTRKNDRPCR